MSDLAVLVVGAVLATVVARIGYLADKRYVRPPAEPVDYDVLATPLIRAADTAQTLDPAIWSAISAGLPPQFRPTWKDYLT